MSEKSEKSAGAWRVGVMVPSQDSTHLFKLNAILLGGGGCSGHGMLQILLYMQPISLLHHLQHL